MRRGHINLLILAPNMSGLLKNLFLSISLLPILAVGQSYNFINYGISDGLAHEKVTDLCEDQFGNLWVATAGGGLSKFNGLNFENYTIKNGLQSNYVRSILSDSRGNIWAATAVGISKLDGFGVVNFNIDSIDQSNNSVNIIYESKSGQIWFSASNGNLGVIDRNDVLSIIINEVSTSSADRIIDIQEDNQGNIWFISAIYGLVRYDGDSFKNVLTNSSYKGYILSLQKDEAENSLLIGTNKGLVSLNTETEQITTIPEFEGTFTKSIISNDDEVYWIVSSNGVTKYEHGKLLQNFGANEGLTDQRINIIYQDREDNLWVGSDGDGLFKLNNETIQFIGKEHGLPISPITSITKDENDNYWFGSFGMGLTMWDGTTFYKENTQTGLPSDYITSLAADSKGSLYIGTRGSGIVKKNENGYKNITQQEGLAHPVVRSLFVDSNDIVWIGTLDGLSRLEDNTISSYTTENGLADNLVWNISETVENEVLVVTRKGFSCIKNGKVIPVELDSSIFTKRINTALKDDFQNYWIGYSGHGLLKVDPFGEQTFYTAESGLSSDLIYNLHFDKLGNIIVGTERGIDKIVMDKGEIQRIKTYSQIEGFRELQTTYGATYQDDNKIWYGSSDGAFIFDLEKEKNTRVEPLIYITGLRLFYDVVDWQDYADSATSWLNLPIGLELPFSENNLVINYQGTSLSNPEAVQYRYRLVGQGSKWSYPTSRSEAVYTNLSPGDYRFEVIASNSDGIWSETPISYSFKVIPPFYLKWWFFLVVIVSILLAIKLFNDYRIKVKLDKILNTEKIRNEEQQRVRKRMARDFHDNLGNQLASISVYTNLISLKLKARSKEIDDLITNIQKHTGSLFTGTKDFIWSMDPDSDDLEEVFTYIKDFGEELFQNTEIDFYSSADDINNLSIPLPPGWSRQLVLICKEAMTNALKHSKATKVIFKLNIIDKYFVIAIEDNGLGFDNKEKSGSMGLRNMTSRADQIGGILEIINDDIGTKVTFRAPMPSLKN